MPSTPGEANDDSVIVSLPIAAQNPHPTCPPEEDRLLQDPAQERERTQSADQLAGDSIITHLPTPEAEAEASAADDAEGSESASRRVEDGEEALMRDIPTPSSMVEDSKDSDSRLAQSMSAAALSPEPWQYRDNCPSHKDRVLPNTTSSFLRAGSKFQGTQQSDRQRYNVQVEIKYVDMEESFLCGYLRIQGLTDDHPTLTTYFEGEIIGNKHTFKTAHPEWGSSEKVDRQHWARFPAWRPLSKQASSTNFNFKDYAQRDHLFMRWKEYFLVPDHKVRTITGASFEGFYYICFNQCLGSVSGIYFHAKSEKYQQLELEHVDDRGCMGAMEFR